MLTSISPLGEVARHNRWLHTATAYVVGSALAGAVVGLTLGAVGRAIDDLGHPSSTATGWAVVALCLVAASLDVLGAPTVTRRLLASPLHLQPIGLPSIHRQVNEDWLNRYRGWVYGAGFGLQLGVGVATIVTTSAVYLVLALEVVIANPVESMVIGAVFGVVRAAPLLSMSRVRSASELRQAHRRLISWSAPARGAAVTVMMLAAGGSAVATVVMA